MFPNQKNRLAPTWGYDKIGRLKCDKTKYGTDNYWPEEGQGYQPTKSGSGGADPNGGERNAKVTRTEDLELGWWNGDKEFVTHKVQDVYDHQANKIPEKTVWDVGHWSNWTFGTF
jgi:hypothetical protein